jgi:exonuclease SbcD
MNPATSSRSSIRPSSPAPGAPQILKKRDGTPGAVLCPVPFLRPRDIVQSQAGLSGGEKQQHLLRSITDYYHQQYEEACTLRGEQAIPVIATGHLTTVGASKSDAVRDIYIGTLDAFRRKTSRLRITSRWGIFTGRR